jgi:branched-chain amino acid aminotransferase
MEDQTGNFCVIDDRIEKTDALTRVAMHSLSVCYEVIRVDEGIFLFLEDHLRRLQHSVKNINNFYTIDFKYIINILLKLKVTNMLDSGNVKLLISFPRELKRDPHVLAYQIIQSYPTEKQYREGIKVSLLGIEREKPNIKYINTSLQEKCRNEIANRHVYEVLLVDKEGFVTEGSKSNVFFLREETLCTPPANRVLKGITREKIIGICKESGYPLTEDPIPANELHHYKAAFISGTSPKVLPIAFIDAVSFSAEHPLIAKIKARYESQIKSYKTKIVQSGFGIDLG